VVNHDLVFRFGEIIGNLVGCRSTSDSLRDPAKILLIPGIDSEMGTGVALSRAMI
jgi:hypothetical protein